ncbi:MAG: aminotransferase class I/II-fold pyridoxal phosphate-dependent enzyme, partial [Spirochaetia bacterium]|nr:aminotransferase class I/II-fold pyridoxal phosphate-dependent enzyme [Spirochaetia bacterium]
MKDEQRHHIETDLMHGGAEVPGNADRALSPALHMSSTFTFDSIEHAEQVMSFESQDYVYTRGNNPTLRLFEQRMTTLEQGSASIAFASGMAAISSTLLAAAGPQGTVIIHKTLYGSSYTLATTLLPKYGITCITADFTDLAALEQLLAAHPQSVLYFESPCNPDLTILDITKISEAAHRYGSLSIIDNTFASPFLQNPLALGADVTLHSATKYICGHGDALGGVATTRDPELAELIKFGYMC